MKISLSTSVADTERRLEQSKRHLRQQVSEIQSGLTGPSSLLAIAGIGALLGSWAARRKISGTSAGAANAKFPIRSVLFALLIRFVLRRIAKHSRVAQS
jgi:hypothetical protein